ncbi:MAG: hypothetical protein GVY28_08865, partial [Alphaproteobacteria bacterium]|nr:hypothetical protein [Alphaproteobacteria bacterium]
MEAGTAAPSPPAGVGTDNDVYAQRFQAADGAPLWSRNGVPVTEVAGQQQQSRLVARPGGGAIIVWNDSRGTDGLNDTYAQVLDAQGDPLWTPNGAPLIARSGDSITRTPVFVAEGELFVPFTESYAGSEQSNVRVQRLDTRHGFWGQPAATLTAVQDVPADQGGFLQVAWLPSDHDRVGTTTITHYSVWRSIQALPKGGPVVDASAIVEGFEGTA